MSSRISTILIGPLFLIFFAVLANGCVKEPALRQEVKTEYLLSEAGFKRWDINEQTPKRQALYDALPQGQISTYMRGGEVYHAYPGDGPYLFVGDEAAYQKYLSLSRDRQMCTRVTGGNQVKFWSCMDEPQQGGVGKGVK